MSSLSVPSVPVSPAAAPAAVIPAEEYASLNLVLARAHRLAEAGCPSSGYYLLEVARQRVLQTVPAAAGWRLPLTNEYAGLQARFAERYLPATAETGE